HDLGADEAEDALPAPADADTSWLREPGSALRYAKQRRLGQGSMGEVDLCKDGRIGRDVAMKTLSPQRADQAGAQQRFLREARVQGQLEHPAIVPVYDLGVDAGGDVFFTMKCLQGSTLAKILKGLAAGDPQITQGFPRRRLLTAFSAVCLAVDFAHSR